MRIPHDWRCSVESLPLLRTEDVMLSRQLSFNVDQMMPVEKLRFCANCRLQHHSAGSVSWRVVLLSKVMIHTSWPTYVQLGTGRSRYYNCTWHFFVAICQGCAQSSTSPRSCFAPSLRWPPFALARLNSSLAFTMCASLAAPPFVSASSKDASS